MTTPSAVYLAANVRAIRERLGLTQKDYANSIGWEQSRLSEIENASSDKWLSYIDRLADAMGISTYLLLKPRKLTEKLERKLEEIQENEATV